MYLTAFRQLWARGSELAEIGSLVERLVARGLGIAEAAEIIAAAVAAGVASAPYRRSPGAVRQERYRERHKASPSDAQNQETEAVTERHMASQSVTSDDASLSKKDNNKHSSKREGDKPLRASQLPAEWKPGDDQWNYACKSLGAADATSELGKFKNHALDKGRVSKNWNAAFRNWTDRALDYRGAKPNGQRFNGSQQRSSNSDFLAGMRSVAEDIIGDSEPSRPAGEEVPRGRIEIDG